MIPAATLTRWKEQALKATPGAWTYRPSAWDHPLETAAVLGPQDGNRITYVNTRSDANAEHIANASPDHVLALIALVERLTEALHHVRLCRECGDSDMAHCGEGKLYLDLLEIP